MSSSRKAAMLVAATYDAALEPGRWPDLLRLIAEQTGSPVARLSLGNSGQCMEAQAWVGTEPSFIRTYDDHFAELDPVMQVVRATVPGTVISQGATSGSALERSDFYQQWVRPQGLYKASMTKFLDEAGAVGVLVCASGLKAEKKTGSNEVRLLYQLAPHLQRAARMHLHLGLLADERDAAAASLDLLRPAIVVVDGAARVKFVNRAAEALLARADGIAYGAYGLFANTAALTNRLRALVAQAAGAARGIAAGGAMLVERPSFKRPYQVLVSPLSGQSTWAATASHGPAAMVLINDPELEPASAEQRLKGLYGMTPAEARVATAVSGGDGLYAVAESLGVLPSTVRTHLHHVFLKTGTRRQAELVRLLEQMAFVLDGDM